MQDFHLWATFVIIGATIIAYASERFSMEAVSLGSLSVLLIFFGLFPYASGSGAELTPGRLLAGFSDPALATVIALLIVGQGLFATDAVDEPARNIGRLGGTSGRRAIFLVVIAAGILSAFLNNTPVVVIFIPILTVIAAQRNYPGFRAFMPLSFMCILGGMTTLLGSSTNLIAAGVAQDYGVTVNFFDLTGMGSILALVGGLYVLFVMPSMMRERPSVMTRDNTAQGAQFIGEIPVGAGHPYIGIKSKAGMFPGIIDLTPRLMHRRDVPILPPFEDITISAGDTLVVTGTRRAFSRALALGSAVAEPDETAESGGEREEAGDDRQRPGPDYHLVEAVVAPGSRFAGRTIQLSGIRARHGVSVFGVQRKSRMARMPLSEIRLEPGDTLLLGGNYEQIMQLRGDHDLLLLEHSAEPVPQSRKAMIAISIFLAIIVFSAFNILPIVVSAITGAALMLAFGCLTIYQAARAFDRQVFLLVGSSIALATALQATGGAALIAEATVMALRGAPVPVVLSVLFVVMAVVTNILSNNATAVLFIPIALGIATRLGAPQEAFIAAVIFAANASFATPIGYQTNLLVMGPGHYSFRDYLKAGLPLVVIIWLTFSFIAPWYYGL
ncbi:SLC13 family permease [Hoeflea poritis]|uniref:SLC13 family permease n=1 Tax=Hoeflea poritis TaxID=2993659 RepID=A0ABT4VQT8_9HYPH|nr:SLC13 family permease [Hoeflea poritis]MDA4847046.1 SLC13 family permease [Hoeflea poritis]